MEEKLEQPRKKRNWKTILIVAAIMIALAGTAYYFYDKNKNAETKAKVDKIKTEQVGIKNKIEAKEKEQKAAADGFLKGQQAKTDKILQIQNNSQPKTLHYENPIIENVDYDIMRDSLDIAQPD